MTIGLEKVLVPSEDIVAREIEGELIIVPLVSGIGDLDDELFTLNDTGRAIWKQLDGTKTLQQVIDTLIEEYEAPAATINRDVLGLTEELLRRRMLIEAAAV